MPPGISVNVTFGMRGDRRGAAVGVDRSDWDGKVMAGMLPGMLLRVIHTCKRGVVFKKRLFVGLGAIMMGGGICNSADG